MDRLQAEESRLAPYAARASQSRGRDYDCQDDATRSAFQRDRDRIIHARAFRRLAYKTQVFLSDAGDLYRSRLTHTMEVTQLARSAARQLALNEDLVECIALAHDIGHPPFGHRGEDMLDELLADHGGFDHHFQALRIVEVLEQRYPHFPGLNLSFELREGLAKLGYPDDKRVVPQRFTPSQAPFLEAQLVDAVDSIAYDCHDIDDALRARLITVEQLQDVELWRGAWQQAVAESPRGTSEKLLADRALRIQLDAFIADLISHSQRLIAQQAPQSVDDIRACPHALIAPGPSMAAARSELEQWLFTHVYRHWQVNRVFHRSRNLLRSLYEFFLEHPDTLPWEHQLRIAVIGLERTVADYLAGMTDRFAQDEYRRLFGLGHERYDWR